MKSIVTYREADGGIINFEAHTSLKSTLELARYYATEKNFPDRYVVYSDRLRRAKTSNSEVELETESGIFMSCILRPSIFPSQAAFLNAMSAAATVAALEEHTDADIGIGWVSDIYCDGVKIGGISIEGKLDNFTTYEYIIVTFTLKTTKENFPPRLTDMIRKVFESENTSVNMIIARNILSKFFKLYANLKTPSKFMSEYTHKFALRGKKVKYFRDDKWHSHRVLGVDANTGALIIDNGIKPDIHVTSPALVSTPKKIKQK